MSNHSSPRLDFKKAEEITAAVYKQYRTRSGFFQNHEVADYECPTGMVAGSREYALYLTYIFALDEDVDSAELWRRVRSFYQGTPWFFDAEQIFTRSSEGLTKALTAIGATKVDSSIKKWRTLSKILLEKYSGDPRSIADRIREVAEVKKTIAELLGTNEERRIHKYLQIMSAHELLKVKKDLGILADRSLAAFTIRTGVLKTDGRLPEEPSEDNLVLSLTGDIWRETSAKLNIPAWELEQSIAMVASKLCAQMKCIICPIYAPCGKKFDLKTVRKEVATKIAETDGHVRLLFCTRCGRDVPKGSRFCDGCGNQIPKQKTRQNRKQTATSVP